MKISQKALLHDEKIVFHSAKHWAIFLPPVLWLGITLVALRLPSELKLLAFITAIFAIVSLVKAIEKYLCHRCILTTKRMLIHEGWFNSKATEIFLQKVEGIKIEQTIWGKLLGYGNLVIISPAGLQHQLILLNDPMLFKRRFHQQLEKILEQLTPASMIGKNI